MIKIKTNLGEIPAWRVLEEINNNSTIQELREMEWYKQETKIDVLTGKKVALLFKNEYPLSQENATIAVQEYQDNYK